MYIRVQQSHTFALLRQGYGKVDRHGGFAYTAFAGVYGNHVLRMQTDFRQLTACC